MCRPLKPWSLPSRTPKTRPLPSKADFASMKDSVRLMRNKAACYRSAGGGNTTSLQRAEALMGFQTVGMMANLLMQPQQAA
ncbi:hypothetical protein [Roseateles sp.]|uniref:hypothetical protein n=1 Tax=Roseateles sp. TaxID=1971397 RepID=UPI00286BF209|nr:hypothetical protein [Roseateles sp.]